MSDYNGGEVTIQSGDDNAAADAAEAAKVEAAQAELNAEAQAGEPEKILGRFDSVDDLASAYQELQRAYNKRDADSDEEEDEKDEPESEDEEAPEASEEVDDDDDDEEDDDDDEPLTEEEVREMQEALHNAVGGPDKYKQMVEWASSNMKESTKEAWNDAIEDGDIEVVEQMAKGFMWDMLQARGYEPKLGGGRAPTNDTKAFNSEAEVVQMMNDPRYRDPSRRDPAFVKEVERRIAMSDVFNSASS